LRIQVIVVVGLLVTCCEPEEEVSYFGIIVVECGSLVAREICASEYLGLSR